ncbi:EAL domain-containing protein [uncultured Lamprocystis sp.]|jgi:diguanylate cyclase (GGDEF)-like protein|uniref:putative bifunctional diguanylate cyclase/phosphodiesterase n=1 Tax=uncultured Lamprocystis sp. TaxID=543132 RepID=UPI0025E0A525|nr:EAL domain-containing protein [uncultured Lamprocystis sp.]
MDQHPTSPSDCDCPLASPLPTPEGVWARRLPDSRRCGGALLAAPGGTSTTTPTLRLLLGLVIVIGLALVAAPTGLTTNARSRNLDPTATESLPGSRGLNVRRWLDAESTTRLPDPSDNALAIPSPSWLAQFVPGRRDLALILTTLALLTLTCAVREKFIQRRIFSTRNALHDAQRALIEHREHFRSLVEANRSGILILDAVGTVQFANPVVATLLDVTPDRLVGSPFGIPVVSEPSGTGQTEIEIVRQNGTAGVAAMMVTETRWQDQPAYLVMLHDITERKAEEERMHRLAFRDPLTGLPNRDLFHDRLHQAIGLANREGKGLALLYLDLDHFKQINDSLGHAVGDALLCAVAERLRTLSRASDTIARMGGDEFTGIFFDVPDRASANRIGEKFLDAFLTPFQLNGHDLHVTPSIGISLFPTTAETQELLIHQADSAMYVAKRAGGHGWRLHGHTTPLVATSRTELDQALRTALAQNQFRLYYQPQIALATGRCVGFEALLRWQHPQLGLTDPDNFLPLLESTGLIVEVGRWVLDESCRQLREWLDQRAEPCTLAVNCSLIQAERGDLFAQVTAALTRHRIAPQLLVLELTEATMLTHAPHLRALLERLVGLGVALHLDDFGTGYSAMNSIKHLPITGIKIDESLIAGLGSDAGDEALVNATLCLAHAIGSRVIAEGVERGEQLALLERHGCDLAQGFLFGPPMPAAEVPAWRDRWAARDNAALAH